MKKNLPLVTVAIPTRNRADFLKEAVRSALCQSYDALDIIISDNCSVDETGAVAAAITDHRVRYFRQGTDLGMVGNWNFCLREAKGEFFLLLCDDDILEPFAVESLLAPFANVSVQLSYGRCRYITIDGKYCGVSFDAPKLEAGWEFICNLMHFKRVAFPSAVLFRTATARSCGGYPMDVGTSTDFVLLFRLAVGGQVAFHKEFVTRYRIHEGALSVKNDALESIGLLLDWFNVPGSPQYVYRSQCSRFFKRYFFRWGISQAFKCEFSRSQQALYLLKTRTPDRFRELLLYMVNARPLRGAITIVSRLLLRDSKY